MRYAILLLLITIVLTITIDDYNNFLDEVHILSHPRLELLEYSMDLMWSTSQHPIYQSQTISIQ